MPTLTSEGLSCPTVYGIYELEPKRAEFFLKEQTKQNIALWEEI